MLAERSSLSVVWLNVKRFSYYNKTTTTTITAITINHTQTQTQTDRPTDRHAHKRRPPICAGRMNEREALKASIHTKISYFLAFVPIGMISWLRIVSESNSIEFSIKNFLPRWITESRCIPSISNELCAIEAKCLFICLEKCSIFCEDKTKVKWLWWICV